jgi:hypothetical protein
MVRISISQEVIKICTWRKMSSLSTRLIHDGNFISESLQNILNDIWVCWTAGQFMSCTYSLCFAHEYMVKNRWQSTRNFLVIRIAPCNRFLYLNLEMTSKEGNLMMSLRYNNIPANFQTMHYIKCIKQWHKRWASWIKPQGYYNEGNYCFYGELNSVSELYDCTMQYGHFKWKGLKAFNLTVLVLHKCWSWFLTFLQNGIKQNKSNILKNSFRILSNVKLEEKGAGVNSGMSSGFIKPRKGKSECCNESSGSIKCTESNN